MLYTKYSRCFERKEKDDLRLVIATNAKAAITNGYHMFACATGIDDNTTTWYA